jgi:hypothetical protein
MAIAGCDKPTPPPDLQTAAPTTPAGPTTQELLAGPRKTIKLDVAPLLVSAPPGWELKRPERGSYVTLRGPSPHFADVEIQVARIMTLEQPQIDIQVAAAIKDKTDSPGSHPVGEMRMVGNLKLLEEISADSPTSQPSSIPDSATVLWRTYVFVPHNGKFDQVSLSVLGCTMGEYNQDGPFIESIINSIASDDTATSGGTAPQ